ncbi:MAG TPA: ankyrin repeat domain-containing protein [Actinomycetota bacterium]|nr:ankyrin repeat domain-containing protein [Actinomycetota bacterium]
MASTSDELFAAIEAGDAVRVAAILDADPGLATDRDAAGVSALMRARYRFEPALLEAVRSHVQELDAFEAAALGDVERLRTLLDADPSPAIAYSGDGFTALHFAAFFGSAEATSLLLARGAPVDALGRGWMTGTALHSAVSRARSDVARILVDAGANPNARQSAGWTPLHAAAHNGDRATVELLLDAGADAAATNDEGRSVLDLATEKGDGETIDRIRSALQAAP